MMSGVNRKNLAAAVVMLNWLFIACGTIGGVGYYAYKVGMLTGITESVEVLETVFSVSNDTQDDSDAKEDAAIKNDIQHLVAIKDWMIRNAFRNAGLVVYQVFAAIMLTVGVKKADIRILMTWFCLTALFLFIDACFLIRASLSIVQTNIASIAGEFFAVCRMLWMLTTLLAIQYYLGELYWETPSNEIDTTKTDDKEDKTTCLKV